MPTYDFKCESCGKVREMHTSVTVEAVKCDCGKEARRVFNTRVAFTIPDYMKAQNDDSRARHKAWIQKPETQARLKSGELDRAASED